MFLPRLAQVTRSLFLPTRSMGETPHVGDIEKDSTEPESHKCDCEKRPKIFRYFSWLKVHQRRHIMRGYLFVQHVTKVPSGPQTCTCIRDSGRRRASQVQQVR